MQSSQLSLSALLLSILLLIHSTTITANPAPIPQDSTSTMTAISQIPDGQVQAPTDSSTDSMLSSSSYENPFTVYTTQTNSLGVITGMPSVWTSQPSAVTSQPASPTLPSYSGYVYANTTTGADVSTASDSSTTEAPTLTSTMSVSGMTLATSTVVASQSRATNASPTLAQATGGAVSNQVAGAGIGLVVLGLGFSLL